MKPNRFSVLIFTLLIFSCQTNKIPRWVTEPPLDDDLFIYVVGNGVSTDIDSQVDKAFQSVVDQVTARFSLEKDEYLENLIIELLDSAFNNSDNIKDELIIADRWNNDEQLYILSRFKRSFFNPIFELYSTRYDEMINFQDVFQKEADQYYQDGELYKAFNSYSRSLLDLLSLEDEFYSKSIIKIIDKMNLIVDSIMYGEIKTFSNLEIGFKNTDKIFSFKILGDSRYDGFLYELDFYEGWETRARSTSVPIRNNVLEFIPPSAKVSGRSSIKSELTFGSLITSLDQWKIGFSTSSYLKAFIQNLNSAIEKSKIEFNFDILSNVKGSQKLISFDNSLVSEGIIRALLENEIQVDSAPLLLGDDDLLSYIREINMLTSNLYSYLLLEENISEDTEEYEGGLLIKISGSFLLIDLKTSKVLLTRTLSTEYLGEVGDESYAYLDYGLKVGQIINDMKF